MTTDTIENQADPQLPTATNMKGRTSPFQSDRVLLWVLVISVGWLAVIPVGFLLWTTFTVDGSLSLANFDTAFNGPTSIRELAANTFTYAIGATILSMFFGTTLAYLVVRTDAPFRSLIFVSALLPLVIPGVLHTIAWIFLGSARTGWLNAALEPILGFALFDIRSMGGMIFVEATNQASLAFLLMYSAFRNMDPSLEESALTNGARLPMVIRRVTLPLVKPALFSSAFIMIVLSLESFEGPTLLGAPSRIFVFTSRIYQLLRGFPPKYGEAGVFAVILLLFVAIGVFAYSRLGKSKSAFETISGKGFRPHRYELGRLKWPAGAFVLGYFIVSILPVVVLLFMSFLPFYGAPSAEMFGLMTLDNYRYVFSNSEVLRALGNSLRLSTGTATILMVSMTMAAWYVVRSPSKTAWLLDAGAFIPIAIPGVVMGAALLVAYLAIPLPIYGTAWMLLLAYCTRYMPYGMRYASASMRQIGKELEEAAYTSGASTGRMLRTVILPLVAPGFMAGWIFIMMSAIRELSASLLLYAPGSQVLGVLIWEWWETGLTTELAAAGVVMIVLLLVLSLVAKGIANRFGVREDTTRVGG